MSSLIARADHPDRIKKWLPCLGCGRRMWTDRCHRICKKCRRRFNANPLRREHHIELPQGAFEESVANTWPSDY